MKIIADENIPLLRELLDHCPDVHFVPGREIRHDYVKDADVLLVRSITRVDEKLLKGTQVKFVGTATAGTDHLDIRWLDQQGITWVDTPGCNAVAVAEYVVACIAYLRSQNLLQGKELRAGVVGVGHVGKKVVGKLQTLGFTVLQNDPPRAKQEPHFQSTPLSEFTDLDLICLHVPLIKKGEYQSSQLIDKNFLRLQKKGSVLLNAGRGEVIHSTDLLTHGQHLHWCFDVWENEPNITRQVLQQTLLATPHIAGYSKEAKLHSSYQLAQALKKMLSLPITINKEPIPQFPLSTSAHIWEEALLSIYNPFKDTEAMKQALLQTEPSQIGAKFDGLRKQYHWRHEFQNIGLSAKSLSVHDVGLLKRLGVSI